MGPSNSSYLSNKAIFHFSDYGGKSTPRKTNIDTKNDGLEVGKMHVPFKYGFFKAILGIYLKVPGCKTSYIKTPNV